MSACQSWFGVERSKNRGFGGAFGARTGFGSLSPRSRSVARTVSGLAGRWNQRRSVCEIRFAPRDGSSRFSSTIWSLIAAGHCSRPGWPKRGIVCRPASPLTR